MICIYHISLMARFKRSIERMRLCRVLGNVLTRSVRKASQLVAIHNRERLLQNLLGWPAGLVSRLESDVFVEEGFMSEVEEAAFEKEVHPILKRLRYEKDHTDNAIYMYRETERTKWSPETEKVLDRLRARSFPPDSAHLSYIHILDLHEDGYIRPHIDNERYCGDIISGVSLLSDSVMRLVHKDETELIVDLLLNRRSLYRLSGVGRWDFTHEILPRDQSTFQGRPIPRYRRVSIICRNLPKDKEETTLQFHPIPE